MRHDKHVKMIIRPDGSCTIDAINFTDVTCATATQQILNALSGQMVDERFKPEAQRLPPQAERRMEGAR